MFETTVVFKKLISCLRFFYLQIVDPWGCVVAQCREGTDLAVAEIDLSYRIKIREEMPVWAHRRYDLYSQVFALKCDPCV